MFLFALFAATAHALPAQVIVGFAVEDLADTTPGEDLWRYTYGVSGIALDVNQGFSVFFDRNLVRNLQSPPPSVGAGWSILSVQPDLALESDGFYDALALTPGASLFGDFSIEFVWLGPGAPGGQRYTIYDTDFSTLSEGTTSEKNGRIVNFSIRSTAGSGDQTLIVGFVVAGEGKPVLVRTIGPALANFGVAGALADTQLRLFQDGVPDPIASNDDWGDAANVDDVRTVAAQVGAFPLAEGSRDSALYRTFASGPYSVQCNGAGGSTGIALAEMYDANPGVVSRLVNVSARTEVRPGEGVLIAGFVIVDGPRTVLIRGVGPQLASFGVNGALEDPVLTVFQTVAGGDVEISANDDWSAVADAAFVGDVAASVGAFPLPAGSKDAAVVLTLLPGVYTAQVRGNNESAGIALAEVYDVPWP